MKQIERITHPRCKMCVSIPALKKFIPHLEELQNAKLYTEISEKKKRIVGRGRSDLNSL